MSNFTLNLLKIRKISGNYRILLAKHSGICFYRCPGLWAGRHGMLPENVIPIEQPKPPFRYAGTSMKSDLVEKASEVVSDPLVLVNLVSKRVEQLNSGRSPLIPTVPSMGAGDIALLEIIEGKIQAAEKAEEA